MKTIGTATMQADGVLVLLLRAADGKGTIGDARVAYQPNDPNYQKVIAHLGGIKVGETKAVPEFKD